MNEIYSIIKFMGIEPNVSEKDLEILEFNLANIKPMFIMDKGKVTFFDKEAEEIMLAKLEEASPDEDAQIQKVRNFRTNGES